MQGSVLTRCTRPTHTDTQKPCLLPQTFTLSGEITWCVCKYRRCTQQNGVLATTAADVELKGSTSSCLSLAPFLWRLSTPSAPLGPAQHVTRRVAGFTLTCLEGWDDEKALASRVGAHKGRHPHPTLSSPWLRGAS